MALLIPWVCRGLSRLFWPLAAINFGVLVSIPSLGGHYFIGVIAGAAITLAAVTWFRRQPAAAAAR